MSGWLILKVYVHIALVEWMLLGLWLITHRDHAAIPEARLVKR